MANRNRIYLAIALVGAVSLGNVVANTDFSQTSLGQSHHLRAPRHRPPPPPPIIQKPIPDFGDPLSGLTAPQLADFNEGRGDFIESDTAESGLGPVFNDVSCVACHSKPAIGGASATLETRFGALVNGKFDPMTELGGSLLQKSAIDPAAQEVIPPDATVIAGRLTTPLFGAGLIEAIPDAVILQNALRQRSPGISGRPSIVVDVATGQTRIGRFGWKAQQATLLAFAGDAYLNEIGITSRLFPVENPPNGNAALLASYDSVADPEDAVDPATGKSDIDHFADFMRFLAPPPQLPLTPTAKVGQLLFTQIGCDACHTPAMTTGKNAIAGLDRKTVALFSDLLLHDMGSLGDGIGQGIAQPGEMRTAPLWGLRARSPFLHDGRAATVDAAIRMHDGEAARARDGFNRLTQQQQRALLEFLASI